MPPKRRNIGPLRTAIDRQGRGSAHARFSGGRWRFCRGRPMCRPGHGSSRDLFTGGHMGPPLRGVEGVPEPTGIGAGRDLLQGGGTEPAPGGGMRLGNGGVWSPRPTEATQVMPSSADVPRAWLPPAKFRPEIWGVGQVAGPYGSNAGGTRQTGRYRAFLGQTRVHSRQRMHSVAFFRRREGSVMSTPMGQTARQRPQWTHFVSSHFTRIREK